MLLTKGLPKSTEYISESNNGNVLNNLCNNALFLEAFRNLNWSRAYDWYCELDGVPSAFSRGGVIGFPASSISFQINDGKTFDWTAGPEALAVPQGRGLCNVDLTFIDDEEGTVFSFFERWFNNVYTSYAGVLPLSEATKSLSIYKLKSLRTKINRKTYRYNYLTEEMGKLTKHVVASRELIVFPVGTLEENEKIASEPRSYTVRLVVAHQDNPDYGNPAGNSIEDALNKSKNTDETGFEKPSFLSKLANYI